MEIDGENFEIDGILAWDDFGLAPMSDFRAFLEERALLTTERDRWTFERCDDWLPFGG